MKSMIKNPKEVERARWNYRRENPLSIEQRVALMNAMYEEAKKLGRLEKKPRQDRKKHKIEMARILNSGV
jgi:hypothetical protein